MSEPWTDGDEEWDSLLYEAFIEIQNPINRGQARKALARRLASGENRVAQRSQLFAGDSVAQPAPPDVDYAVHELLVLVAIEGISTLSRGGKGCVFRALEALRPDIARQWADDADPHHLLRVYFPDPGEPHHVLIMDKHTGRPIGCMTDPDHDALRHAQREDPGCSFAPVDPEECPVCRSFKDGTA